MGRFGGCATIRCGLHYWRAKPDVYEYNATFANGSYMHKTFGMNSMLWLQCRSELGACDFTICVYRSEYVFTGLNMCLQV